MSRKTPERSCIDTRLLEKKGPEYFQRWLNLVEHIRFFFHETSAGYFIRFTLRDGSSREANAFGHFAAAVEWHMVINGTIHRVTLTRVIASKDHPQPEVIEDPKRQFLYAVDIPPIVQVALARKAPISALRISYADLYLDFPTVGLLEVKECDRIALTV